MAEDPVKHVIGDGEDELFRVRAIVSQAIVAKASLFLGRFLSDMTLGESELSSWCGSNIVLRQFGGSCFVNAYSPLAEVKRTEIGLEKAEAALQSGRYDVVLLSHILTALDEDLLAMSDLESLASLRPPHVTLILTGRSAPSNTATHGKHCRQRRLK
jgi:cob(I)alamin adenosyltransferase